MIQEMTILLNDEEHIVYITELEMTDKGLKYAFGTTSEGYEDILAPHIENCLKLQINDQVKIYRETRTKNIFVWLFHYFKFLWSKK